MVDIPGYEGRYGITEDGKVWSHLYKRWMKQRVDRSGYLKVALYKPHNCKGYFVHRLVALTYLPNPSNYPQVNHLDGNRLNPNLTNLEWCTQSQNINHAYMVLGHTGPWKGKKRPEIKTWLKPFEKGNTPWNDGISVGKYIPRKREVVTDPICPNCKVKNRWSLGRYPDGVKRYPKVCNICAEALHEKAATEKKGA